MVEVEEIKKNIPAQMPGKWVTVPQLANELADLIKKGIKTASCGSFASYQQEESAPRIGSYNIILDGQNVPVCVIRLISMQLVRFCDVTEAFAAKKVKAI
ncbi:putative cytoplasmic protein [Klebsiella pneumoniae]|uniref:Putative cytoplasmic protein n=1 Tax=Klebsiella pneumoniae TaxID=573 RepID=A0A378F601_KLEPN|nr:putative cytoplasmic protein [Klebsiella pneumoniae]